MTMLFDPRRLMTLRAVVHAGSISAGARALGWTQPAVTRHVQELERAAGMPLLVRHASGVTPTEAGSVLLAHADAIASHMDAAAAEMTELRELRRGTVRLACFPSGLAVLVPAALAKLQPGLDVQLIEAEPDDAVELLRDGHVDVAVTFDYPEGVGREGESWLGERVIAADEVVVVVPSGQPVAAFTDLADAPWIAGCERCRGHLLATARAAGFEPRIRHETDDYVVVQSLVARRLGVALLPMLAIDAYRDPRVDVRVLPNLGSRQIVARFRPGTELVPGNGAVLHALQTARISPAIEPGTQRPRAATLP